MSTPLTPGSDEPTPESTRDSTRDSTIGDEATTDDALPGPEELDDVTADGSTGDGTFGDGDLGASDLAEGGDVLDEMLANHASGGWSDPAADGLSNGDALDAPATGDEEPGQQPVELDADAMGRPVSGSMNDDDQGMENAGANLGD